MADENVNGVNIHFGPRDPSNTTKPSTPSTRGHVKELKVPVRFDALPTTSATDALILAIPAGSILVSSRLVTTTNFASTSGTTTINIGLSTPAGVVVDADGIDAALAVDNLDVGEVVLCDGALIGQTVGNAAVQVTVVPSVADLTAGVGILYVEYIPVVV